MIKNSKTYLLIYRNSNESYIHTKFLTENSIPVKYADNKDHALDIARKHKVGIFLAFYDSTDESSIYALRSMMQQFPYVQRFLLASEIDSDILELAVNKAHINYFLLFPLENEKLLLYINKAFRRYRNVIRPYDKLDKLSDITLELVEDIEKYHDEANKDALTGLLNRRSFDSIIKRYFSSYNSKKIPFVMALIDLDRFKKINDTYGHTAGDLVLKKFGKTMTSCSRLGEDLIFRYGGEEFVVLSLGSSESDMNVFLDRLKKLVKKINIEYNGYKIKFTFSAGITAMKKGITIEKLISNADEALYYAKNNGRNQILVYNHSK